MPAFSNDKHHAATESNDIPYEKQNPAPKLQHSHFLNSTNDRATLEQEASSSPGNTLFSSPALRASQRQHNPDHAMPVPLHPAMGFSEAPPDYQQPIVQGIQLVPLHVLPDRFRSIFPFMLFNAIQSACFESIYNSNDNCIFSSPTGSGKTVLFELAICRLIGSLPNGSFKVVYMAPTKSLCSERLRDWKIKFGSLDIRCEELTGDSEISSLQHVQKADVIITTPEKWDSMTRRWKDHEKLVRLIKLLLIDEVHILNKDRGTALEVVVPRMKSIRSGTRIIALSATVPNSQDIATWLGKNDEATMAPAIHRRFGEEFRPVILKRHVCGYQSGSNPFGFDAFLTKKYVKILDPRPYANRVKGSPMSLQDTLRTNQSWYSVSLENHAWKPPLLLHNGGQTVRFKKGFGLRRRDKSKSKTKSCQVWKAVYMRTQC